MTMVLDKYRSKVLKIHDCYFFGHTMNKYEQRLQQRQRAEKIDELKKLVRGYRKLAQYGVKMPSDRMGEALQMGISLRGVLYDAQPERVLKNGTLYPTPVAYIPFEVGETAWKPKDHNMKL